MKSFKETYYKEIAPALTKELAIKNTLAVPKVLKVVLNVGMSQALKDAKYGEVIESTLKRVTGQKPVKRLAKKSISSFKIRQGMVVGMMVTMRGKRMYDFLDKFIHVSLARIRDFRGLSTSLVDDHGNMSLGFKEHLIFPEIKSDEVERIHGIQVTITTNAHNKEKGLVLFRKLGFPFNTVLEKNKKSAKRTP